MTDQEQNTADTPVEAQDEFDGMDDADKTDGEKAADKLSEGDLKPGQSRAALRGIPAGPNPHPRVTHGSGHSDRRSAEDDVKDIEARDQANKKAHDAGLA